ncbi:MAG: hypothetical protein JOY71_16940 [Acetobacteraceae bacterium]|nr:hypothetical protein [Acetobacteraceae bacterium]MBV8523782.1 hypothetical protein [Acetobacteraceae bacterium]
MRVISTASQIFIERTPTEVFRYVTTPDNWVGTHPVTASVRGATHEPAGAGTHWKEMIQPNPQAEPFETEWWVTIAVPSRLWIIETEKLAFPGLRCRIAYTFVSAGKGTHFYRDMACLVDDEVQLDPGLADALANPAPHDAYVASIKEKLEYQSSGKPT